MSRQWTGLLAIAIGAILASAPVEAVDVPNPPAGGGQSAPPQGAAPTAPPPAVSPQTGPAGAAPTGPASTVPPLPPPSLPPPQHGGSRLVPPPAPPAPPQSSDRGWPEEEDDDEDAEPRRDVEWLFDLLRRLPPRPQPQIASPPARILVGPGAAPTRPSLTRSPPTTRPARPPRRAGSPPPPRPTPAPVAPVAGEVLDRIVLVAIGGGADRSIEAAIGADLGLAHEIAYESAVLGLRLVRFRVPPGVAIADVLAQLGQDADVVSAQPEFVFRAVGGPGAAALPQYAAEKLRIGEAHAVAVGRNVRVAVIDTALDAAHPALAGAVAADFNALGEAGIGAEAHGTAIAGILAARATMKGIAPGADVLSVSAFRSSDGGAARSSTLALVKGIDWALAKGARVVNMSFAGPADPLLGKAIAEATGQGMVFVAAAGNAGPGAPAAYPAAFPETIAVTATDSADRLYAKANRGSYVTLAAPGVDIMAPAPKGRYELSSGTSMAAAHVSGVVALLLERDPGLTVEDVRQILGRSARKPRAAADLGAGIVDAAGALGRAR